MNRKLGVYQKVRQKTNPSRVGLPRKGSLVSGGASEIFDFSWNWYIAFSMGYC